MAHIHRVIFAALVLLSSWLPSTAFASFPATQSGGTSWEIRNSNNGLELAGPFSSKADAYAQNLSRLRSANPSRTISELGEGYQYSGCMGYSNNGSFWVSHCAASYTLPVTYACPAGSTLSGSSCTCNAGLTQSGSTCVNPDIQKCSDAKGGVDLFDGFSSLPTVGASFCPSNGNASSCASTVVGGFCVIKASVKKCTHEVKYGGGTCTPPAPTPTESPVPTPCKGTYGQVNGVDVCLPLGSDPSVSIETGKKTETTTTPSGGGGSTTTTEQGTSTCIGSQCSTTTTKTTTGPDGVPSTSTETKSESKDDFCKNNPRSPQCISSSFSGSCSAAFSCDGDAVMCAITREQHTRNCKLFDDNTSTEAQLYGAEKNKVGSQTGSLPGSQTVAISSSSFDTSDAIGGGSGCIADKSVAIAGSVVTIPFSNVCGHLAMLGNILLAVSFLLAGRIVVRG